MRRLTVLLLPVLCVLMFAWAARADDDKTVAKDDTDFLKKAMECGNAEVKLSQLAETRAASDKVKEFARMMVKDHTEANAKLAEHARTLKVAVLAGTSKEFRAISDNLSKLRGADFDRAYMERMVKDHEDAIKLFESQAKVDGEGNMKKFAEQTLPHLREHLKKAQEIAKEVGGQ